MTHIFSNEVSLVIYILVFATSSILYLHKDRIYLGNYKAQWINTFFIIAIPVIFSAIRYRVGADYHVYLAGINEYNNISIIDYLKNADLFSGEPIGMVIVKKLSQGSTIVYFALLALLTYVPIVYVLMNKWNELSKPTLALTAFCYMIECYSTSFNIIKQSIAISFVFCGLTFVYERKPAKFIIMIMCAFLFHQTALVTLPIYFMCNEKLTVSSGKKIISFFGTLFVIVGLNTILEAVGGDWADYIDSTGTDNKIFYIYLFWMIVFLIFSKDLIDLDRRNELLILLYSIGTILNVIGFWSVFGKRIGLYFTIPRILLISQLPICAKIKKMRKLVVFALIVYLTAIFTYLYYVLGNSGIIPYAFSI